MPANTLAYCWALIGASAAWLNVGTRRAVRDRAAKVAFMIIRKVGHCVAEASMGPIRGDHTLSEDDLTKRSKPMAIIGLLRL